MTRPCLAPLPDITPITLSIPEYACDSHAHTFGPYDTYPLSKERSYTPDAQTGSDFVAHLDQIGFERGVLVTGSACGQDNGSVLEALRRYPARLRGVAVPDPDVTEKELDNWSELGMRGVRINLFRRNGQAVYKNGVGLDVIKKLAPRLKARGWHLQVWIHAPDIPEMAPDLLKLGLPLVVDHMGRMSTSLGAEHAGIEALARMLADGKAWTKISGADRVTTTGFPFHDVDPLAQKLIKANIDRIVWGTDWPHINYFDPADMPDDGHLVNLLDRWLPDKKDLQKVLVDNPAILYGWV